MNSINFSSTFFPRFRTHILLLTQFDFVDHRLLHPSATIERISLRIGTTISMGNDTINNENFSLNSFIEGLALEWNCNQRFFLKSTTFNQSNNLITIQTTLHRDNLYKFLDYCVNSIFTDKNSTFNTNGEWYIIRALNKTQWHDLKYHSFLLNYFFSRRNECNIPSKKIEVCFNGKNNLYFNNFLFNVYLLPDTNN